ncbi:MAG: hypothetical protein HC925_09770, partial [Coleofasciculaceae cyanobacterium SM2_3_26]|nr:hypothetical protein [Coleofasciculaceae cyanobacterium SM2_3_26]
MCLSTLPIGAAGECKIVLTEEGITAFIEEGDRLEVLDDERPTREVNVPFDRVVSLSYRETKKLSAGRLIGNTLVFGIIGAALLTRPRKLSQIDIGFATAPAIALVDNTPTPTEPTATSPQPAGQLTLVADREIGGIMRLRLEQLTGMVAEVPPEEE